MCTKCNGDIIITCPIELNVRVFQTLSWTWYFSSLTFLRQMLKFVTRGSLVLNVQSDQYSLFPDHALLTGTDYWFYIINICV